MLLALGVLLGIAISALILVVLVVMQEPVNTQKRYIIDKLKEIGPKEKGLIIEPDSDAEIARQAIIEKNKQEGRDTPIEELL